MKRYYITYDLGRWEDEIFVEEFDTLEEMRTRFEELMYEVGTIDMWETNPDWDEDKKIF